MNSSRIEGLLGERGVRSGDDGRGNACHEIFIKRSTGWGRNGAKNVLFSHWFERLPAAARKLCKSRRRIRSPGSGARNWKLDKGRQRSRWKKKGAMSMYGQLTYTPGTQIKLRENDRLLSGSYFQKGMTPLDRSSSISKRFYRDVDGGMERASVSIKYCGDIDGKRRSRVKSEGATKKGPGEEKEQGGDSKEERRESKGEACALRYERVETSGKKPCAIAIRTNIRSRDERQANKEKREKD